MTTPRAESRRILEAIYAQQWAIQPEWLDTIVGIAERRIGDPEAVLAARGEPLRDSERTVVRDGVAIVPVRGPIFRYANLFTALSGASSIDMLALDVGAAVNNSAVKAIVLEIDSPGGMVAGVSEFAEQIRAATQVKPVVAYVSNLGASAAYWIASAAGEVVARDTAALGSIGVVMRMYRETDDGAIKFVSAQSPRKHARPDSEAGQAIYQREVDALADVFIGAVAGYRGVAVDTVLAEFGGGATVLGEAAVAAGMADRLGSLESIIAGLAGGQPSKRTTTMSGNTPAPTITLDTLRAQHPDLVAQLHAEGAERLALTAELLQQRNPALLTQLRAEGATAERERIQGVQAAGLPGYEVQLAAMMFDGKTTAGEAALAINKLEREARARQVSGIASDAAQLAAVAAMPAPTAAQGAAQGPVEDRCKAKWDADPEIRSAFTDLKAFTAYTRAQESGRVKILGKATA
jgi:capsid assembly protease